jgi:hypothetical protein
MPVINLDMGIALELNLASDSPASVNHKPFQLQQCILHSHGSINNTDQDSPVAAPIEITVTNTECKMTVSSPLSGSGVCQIDGFDKKSGHIQFVSYGPPVISWSGTVKGNLASGTYRVDAAHQTGSFYLAVSKEPDAELRLTLPPQTYEPSVPRTSCTPAVESSISGDIEGWDGENDL